MITEGRLWKPSSSLPGLLGHGSSRDSEMNENTLFVSPNYRILSIQLKAWKSFTSEGSNRSEI